MFDSAMCAWRAGQFKNKTFPRRSVVMVSINSYHPANRSSRSLATLMLMSLALVLISSSGIAQTVETTAVSKVRAASKGDSRQTSPGGSDQQIQFNQAGVF